MNKIIETKFFEVRAIIYNDRFQDGREPINFNVRADNVQEAIDIANQYAIQEKWRSFTIYSIESKGKMIYSTTKTITIDV